MYWLGLDEGAVDLQWDKEGAPNTWTFGEVKGASRSTCRRIGVATVRGHDDPLVDPRMQLLGGLGVEDGQARPSRGSAGRWTSRQGTLRGTPFRVEARLLTPDATARRREPADCARLGGEQRDRRDRHAAGLAESRTCRSDPARGRNLAELLG